MPFNSFPIIVSRAKAATPTVFVDIAELETAALPELGSNDSDSSVQNKTSDVYVVSSLLRRKPVQMTFNMLPGDATQDHLTGLYQAKIANTLDGYKWAHSASGLVWVASGQITNLAPKTPMEGKIQLAVTLRLSGVMSINGVTVGT